MSTEDFKALLNRYLTDSLTTDELHQLLHYLQLHEHDEPLKQAVQQALRDQSFTSLSDKKRTELIFQKIMQQAGNGPPQSEEPIVISGRRRHLFLRYAAAAAILVAVLTGVSIYLLKGRSQSSTLVKAVPTKPAINDVAPGGNRATLQLADGSIIALDDSATGILAQQGNTKVIKLNDGKLQYNCLSKSGEVLYNTISTPRGGQYHIILPDGSKVWLNAASSLRFPTVFAGAQRAVTLTGEAYFEIEHNKQMPFQVEANEMKIEVLGTHFNVMSYENEEKRNTTLLQGSVKVFTTAGSKTLKPGEQASLSQKSQSSQTIPVQTVDVEQVIAWKNGLFQFNSNDIQTIMRQIERWYDVEVHYKGSIPDGHYSGTVARANNLTKVLRILEESDIKFLLEGKTLTVL